MWHQQGIVRIKHLFDVKRLKTFNEMKEMCPQVNFVMYQSLIKAIPKDWKTLRIQGNMVKAVDNSSNTLTSVLVIYKTLCKDESLLQNKLPWFNAQIQKKYSIKDYINVLLRITSTTISVKLRSFQYKLLLNAITTNIKLFYYKIKKNKLCTFCEEVNETLYHLFYDCPYVRKIWQETKRIFKIDDLSYEQVLCNTVEKNPKHSKNCILLIVKVYVYRSRCMNQRISSVSCLKYINDYINTEYEIARSKKLHLHEMKWAQYEM